MSRVLIIEDDEQVRSMLRFRLEDAGHDVAEASEGGEGMALFKEAPFPLVITDLIMAGMEGIETIRTLKKTDTGVKLIAISGGGRADPHEYLEMAKALGADRVFAKPVDWDELIDSIGELI